MLKRRNTGRQKAKEVINSLKKNKKEDKPKVEFLGSGCTTLNLALSGKSDGGWARGRIVNIVGDGSSGKTLLALELAFWCFSFIHKITSAIFGKTEKVKIVYNNSEGVMDFPLKLMYGKRFIEGVEWIRSGSIEEMGRDYSKRVINLKKGEFLLYIVDSWDALDSSIGNKAFKESVQKNKEMKGSFNLEKQKFTSKFFQFLCGEMDMDNNKVDSTLVIISQVRSKIGVTFGKKTYRAGGKALDFYTHQVAWIREVKKLRKTKFAEQKVYGIKSRAKIERSKVAKPFRESDFTILYDYGIDNMNSTLDYIYGNKVVNIDGQKFSDRKELIKYIERNNLEDNIIKRAEEKWNKVEDAFAEEVKNRKSRF